MDLEEELGISIGESEVNLGVLEAVENLSEFIISIEPVGEDRT